MQAGTKIYSLLADLVLVVHFAFVSFVALGFVAIWVGYFCRWQFVRDLRFRVAHLLAMGVVLAESLTGYLCPLTNWENQLRRQAGGAAAYSGSFIQHWIGRILFHDWNEQTFTFIYAGFFILVGLTFWVVRPQRRVPASSRLKQ
jgi:hypothetical protein